jgi:hypothetical protein
MNRSQYDLVAAGWLILLCFLTVFWYFTLRRLEVVLRERLESIRSHQSISGLPSLIKFILWGRYNEVGDERLAGVCKNLRRVLYGYAGSVVGYIVFLVIYRPRF